MANFFQAPASQPIAVLYYYGFPSYFSRIRGAVSIFRLIFLAACGAATYTIVIYALFLFVSNARSVTALYYVVLAEIVRTCGGPGFCF